MTLDEAKTTAILNPRAFIAPASGDHRYHPMGEYQKQRLVHMLDLDRNRQFYKHKSMRDFHLMESLRKRGYVWFSGEDWFLSDAGKLMAEKLNPNDGLPF